MAAKPADKSGRAATLIPYARSILQAMKENGYRGTVWDDVLNEYEKATAPLPEIGALPSSCEGYGVCLRHACLSAGRCTIIGTNNAAQPESTGTVATEGVRPPAAPTGDTPRTDARWNELYDRGGNTITWFEVAERVRDFARQLERELAAARSTTQERKA